MEKGVVYQLMGNRYLHHAMVSIYSLRKYYNGPVCIQTPEVDGAPNRIAADKRLNLSVRELPRLKCLNSIYVAKTTIHRHTPFQRNAYLDADTIVMGPIDELWPKEGEFVVTQFGNRKTNHGRVAGRINKWRGLAKVHVEEQLKNPKPSPNAGVFGFDREDPFMDEWHELAWRGARLKIPCESSLNILYYKTRHRLLDDRYNCSPRSGVNWKSPVIWHTHNATHRYKVLNGMFDRMLKEIKTQNLGNINEWWEETRP